MPIQLLPLPHTRSHLSLIAGMPDSRTLVLERPLPFNASLLYNPVIQT